MSYYKIKSHAKINLALNVIGKKKSLHRRKTLKKKSPRKSHRKSSRKSPRKTPRKTHRKKTKTKHRKKRVLPKKTRR